MRAHYLLRWVSLMLVGAFGLLALDSMRMLNRYQAWGRGLFVPLEAMATGAADQLSTTWSTVSAIGSLQAENRRLRAENEQLLERNRELETIGQENVSLRRLLAFERAMGGHQYRPATVIARGTNNLQPMLTIDRGASNGLQPGMTVVDGGGLVGRIIALNAGNAVVLPVDNAGSTIAAVVAGGDPASSGVVQYEAGTGLLLKYVQATAPVKVGDVIVTSGLGGTYPRDMPIGTVKEIRQRAVDLFQVAVLTPAANPGDDRVVLVVTDFVPPTLKPELR